MSKNKSEVVKLEKSDQKQTKESRPTTQKPEFFSKAYPVGERWSVEELTEFYNEACKLLETADPTSFDTARLLVEVVKTQSKTPSGSWDERVAKTSTEGIERLTESIQQLNSKLAPEICTPENLEKLSDEAGDGWDLFGSARKLFSPFKERVLAASDPKQAKELLDKKLVELPQYCKTAQNWKYEDALEVANWLVSNRGRADHIATVIKPWQQAEQAEIINKVLEAKPSSEIIAIANLVRDWPQTEGKVFVDKILASNNMNLESALCAAANWDEGDLQKLIPSREDRSEMIHWFTLMKHRTKPLTHEMMQRIKGWCEERDKTGAFYKIASQSEVEEGFRALRAHPETFEKLGPDLAKAVPERFNTTSIGAVAMLPMEYQFRNMETLAQECHTNYYHAVANEVLDVVFAWDKEHRKDFYKYLCSYAKNGVLSGHDLSVISTEAVFDDPAIKLAIYRTKVELELFPDGETRPGGGAKGISGLCREAIEKMPTNQENAEILRQAYTNALNDILNGSKRDERVGQVIQIGKNLNQVPDGMEQKIRDLIVDNIIKGNAGNAVELPEAFKLSAETLASIDKLAASKSLNLKEDSVEITMTNRDLKKFYPLTFEKSKAFCLEKAVGGEVNYIRPIIHLFDELPNDVANALIKADKLDTLVYNIKKFPNLDIENLFKKLVESDRIDLATIANDHRKKPDRAISMGFEMFGEQFSADEYKLLVSIMDGTIDDVRMKSLGLKNSGESGIRELRLEFDKFKKDLFNDESIVTWLNKDAIFRQFFKKYIRYDESEYGAHSDNSFEALIRRYEDNKDNPAIKLDAAYTPSGTLIINKVDAEARKTFTYSEQFIQSFNTIKESLIETAKFFTDKEGPVFNGLYKKVEEIREGIILRLEEKLKSSENLHVKARENIERQISDLKSLNTRNLSAIQANFAKLANHQEFAPILRQIVFTISLLENPQKLEEAKKFISEGVSFESSDWLINFVSHTTNEMTWKKYFPDKEAWKKFTKISNVLPLQEEQSRAQNQGQQGRTTMDFVPTKGLLMEVSGHIADACWAYDPDRTYDFDEDDYDKEDFGAPMAEAFPNFTSLIMIQNKGTKFERLGGACFLLETNAFDGTPLLVIRGLNPLQNIINDISISDYMEKFTAYVRSIADKQGRKLAIVIDDHSGGSSTNRPVLFNYLSQLSSNLTRIELATASDSTINGYNIVDDVFLI